MRWIEMRHKAGHWAIQGEVVYLRPAQARRISRLTGWTVACVHKEHVSELIETQRRGWNSPAKWTKSCRVGFGLGAAAALKNLKRPESIARGVSSAARRAEESLMLGLATFYTWAGSTLGDFGLHTLALSGQIDNPLSSESARLIETICCLSGRIELLRRPGAPGSVKVLRQAQRSVANEVIRRTRQLERGDPERADVTYSAEVWRPGESRCVVIDISATRPAGPTAETTLLDGHQMDRAASLVARDLTWIWVQSTRGERT